MYTTTTLKSKTSRITINKGERPVSALMNSYSELCRLISLVTLNSSKHYKGLNEEAKLEQMALNTS
jgi:hypothetical protein